MKKSASLETSTQNLETMFTLASCPGETWKAAIYDGKPVAGLFVSDRGRMRRGLGQITRGSACYGDGRLKQMMVCIADPGYKHKHRAVNLHRIVLETFTGVKWVPGYQVDHVNHEVADGRVENLRMVSRSDNMRNRRLPPPRLGGKCPKASLYRYNQCLKYGAHRLDDLPKIIQREYHRIRIAEHRARISRETQKRAA